MAKYYPPPVEAFQINDNDNTEMIEYFQKTIPDFDIIHGKVGNDSPHWQGAVLAHGVSYYFRYGDWVAELKNSFYGIEIIPDTTFTWYYQPAIEYLN